MRTHNLPFLRDNKERTGRFFSEEMADEVEFRAAMLYDKVYGMRKYTNYPNFLLLQTGTLYHDGPPCITAAGICIVVRTI